MGRFSNWIQSPGTGGPGTFQGIKNLGFAVVADLPTLLGKYLRVDVAQTFSGPETLQGRTNIGLGNVNNTSDANKPVSTATQTALNLKADLASPPLTGNPTAPTQTAGNNSARLATTAFVATAVAAVPVATRSGPTTLSGTATDLTVPTAAKRIMISFNAWKLSGTDNPAVRIGTGGVATATGYTSTTTVLVSGQPIAGNTSTTSFINGGATAANLYSGALTLVLHDAATNTWVLSGSLQVDGAQGSVIMTGKVSLAGAINLVRITSLAGANTLSGSVSIIYE